MLLIIAALLAAALPADPLVGEWRTRQMEMAGGLELRADGRFRYALSYGAADETGEGRWERSGDGIRLTRDPMPVPPSFVLVHHETLPRGEQQIQLVPPGFGFTGSFDVLLYEHGADHPDVAKATRDGRVSLGDRPYPARIVPAVPFYPVEPSGAVLLDAAQGHRLTFRFEPNDLGKAAFRGEPLQSEGETLRFIRFDTAISFRKVTP